MHHSTQQTDARLYTRQFFPLRARFRSRFALACILLLASGLHLINLREQGAAGHYNLYYAATVRSMSLSWHNFVFAAFDPGGFVTVDKPPVGFWLQVASVKLLGWSGLALLLPQALAGIASVAVLYGLVRRAAGPLAGLIAALVLTLTPISVATDRNTTIDSLLVLSSLLAVWAISCAADTGRLRTLLLAMSLIGIGFNIKMLQAFLIVPACFVVYGLTAPLTWWRRLTHVAAATSVLLAVSLVWAVLVDATPAAARPFIGSSENNTVFSLILGHNGASRLLSNPWHAPVPLTKYVTDEIGAPGLLRLFGWQLGGQASWLLVLAAFGVLAAAALATTERMPTRWNQALLLWSTWVLPQLVFFSVGRKFHRYYLAMLAPGIAALVGIGLVALWTTYRQAGWRGWLLPCSFLATAGIQAAILCPYGAWARWLLPPLLGLTGLAAGCLLVYRVGYRPAKQWWAVGATALGCCALVLAPGIWSLTPLWGSHPDQPFAGPEVLALVDHTSELPDLHALTAFLLQQQHGERFLAATLRATTAAPLILATNQPVMAVGGYSGSDEIVTAAAFGSFVARGDVRFVLVPEEHNRESAIVAWLYARCRLVPATLWHGPQTAAVSVFDARAGGPQQLFDCQDG